MGWGWKAPGGLWVPKSKAHGAVISLETRAGESEILRRLRSRGTRKLPRSRLQSLIKAPFPWKRPWKLWPGASQLSLTAPARKREAGKSQTSISGFYCSLIGSNPEAGRGPPPRPPTPLPGLLCPPPPPPTTRGGLEPPGPRPNLRRLASRLLLQTPNSRSKLPFIRGGPRRDFFFFLFFPWNWAKKAPWPAPRGYGQCQSPPGRDPGAWSWDLALEADSMLGIKAQPRPGGSKRWWGGEVDPDTGFGSWQGKKEIRSWH